MNDENIIAAVPTTDVTHLFTKTATDTQRSGSNHPSDSTSDNYVPTNGRDSFGQEHDSENSVEISNSSI